MRWLFVAMLSVLTSVVVAETWPSGGAAVDSVYVIPADQARMFQLGDLPVYEAVCTADTILALGDVRRVEVYPDGDAKVSFRKTSTSNVDAWFAVVTMNSATAITVSAWSDY